MRNYKFRIVEKKRIKFFIRMKLTFTAIFLSLIFSTHAQKLETFKNYCGGFYKSMADLLKMQQREISFYDFKAGQSFHEFTFQAEMLADIKKKLRPGGIL